MKRCNTALRCYPRNWNDCDWLVAAHSDLFWLYWQSLPWLQCVAIEDSDSGNGSILYYYYCGYMQTSNTDNMYLAAAHPTQQLRIHGNLFPFVLCPRRNVISNCRSNLLEHTVFKYICLGAAGIHMVYLVFSFFSYISSIPMYRVKESDFLIVRWEAAGIFALIFNYPSFTIR